MDNKNFAKITRRCLKISSRIIGEYLLSFIYKRLRTWQPTPVFLPGESQGRGSWWAAVYGLHRVGHDWSDLAAAAAAALVRHCSKWVFPITFPLQHKFCGCFPNRTDYITRCCSHLSSFALMGHRFPIWDCHLIVIFVWCFKHYCCCCLVTKSCLPFCNPMDCSLPGSSVHGIFQKSILEWIAISFSKGSSQPRDLTRVSCIGRQILYHWSAWEAHKNMYMCTTVYVHNVNTLK